MRKTKRSTNPPWGHRRIGKYSLEEIALEFIVWEDTDKRNDVVRKNFVHQALDQSFGQEDRGQMLREFVATYEKLYEKIYQRKLGNRVKDDRATPESVRRLLNPRIEKKAA